MASRLRHSLVNKERDALLPDPVNTEQKELLTTASIKDSTTDSIATSDNEDVPRDCKAKLTAIFKWMKEELFEFRIVVPIYLTLLFTQAIFFESLVFVGHINGTTHNGTGYTTVNYNDAAALAVSIINITGISVAYGLSTAVDTLCSQAFGSKNYVRVGVVFQRGLFVLTLCMLPVLALWFNMGTILNLLQQDPTVVRLTAKYVKIFSAALPSVFLVILLAKYLQSQGIILVFILAGLGCNVINIVLHAGLILGAKMGFNGAIAAMTISQGISPVFVLIYMWSCGLHKKTWGGWSWASMMDWWPFIKLAIPGLLMVGFEWWSYEIGGLVVGTISKAEQGIHYIVLNINTVLFSSALATGISASIRVGNELGAGNATQAKRVFYMTIFVTLCEVTFLAAGIHTLKFQIGKLFTNDQMLLHECAKMMDLLAFFIYFDHLQGALGGVLRGSGRQFLGAVVNFISFYTLGLPLGIFLALWMEMGTKGIWIGLLCGALTETIVFFVVLLRTDWDRQANEAISIARRHPLRPVKKEDGEKPLQEVFELREKQHANTAGYLYQIGARGSLQEGTIEDTRVQRAMDSDEEEVIMEKGANHGADSDEEEVIMEKASDRDNIALPSSSAIDDEEEETTTKDGEKETFIASEQGGDNSVRKPWAIYQYSKTKLVLTKVPFVVIAVAILLIGVIASTHPYTQPLTTSLTCNDTSIYEL